MAGFFEDLASRKCRPCEGGAIPLTLQQAKNMIRDIPGWALSADGKAIAKEYSMKNFLSAVGLINAIAPIAQAEDHHPDLHLTGYRKLKVELATHAIGGLSENDFILAAKIEQLPKELKEQKK